MPGHKNDGNVNIGLGQFGLKIEPAQARQSDVKNEATRTLGLLVLQKFGRRRERLHLQAYRTE
jgi:hypothetical protein